MIKKTLGKYLILNNNIFKELICNLSIFQIGDDNLKSINKSTLISPKISTEFEIEPFPIEALIAIKRKYPDFILEVYHGKLVSEWQNLLDEIFNYLLDLHFQGQRQFVEFGKTNISLSFIDKRKAIDQITENLKVDFTFLSYEKKIKIIKDSFNCLDPDELSLQNIFKNVLIRNSIQHRNRIIDDYLLRKCGTIGIIMLDINGNKKTLKEGDDISIYLPQIYDFKKSLTSIINKWINDAKI